jgi:hypothetical protein
MSQPNTPTMATTKPPERFESATKVAQAANWVRWKTGDECLFVLVMGTNTIALSVDPKLGAPDTISLLMEERRRIDALIRQIHARNHLYGYLRRQL